MISFSSRATAIFCFAVGCLAGFLGSSVLGGGSGSTSDGASGKTEQVITAPLSVDEVMQAAQDRKLDKIFWLGPPPDGQDVRIDTRSPSKQFALAYTAASKRASFEENREQYTYDALLNTNFLPADSLPPAQYIQQLRSGAVSIQVGQGFTAYVLLPPLATNLAADIILISNDQRYLGRLVSGDKELVPAQRKQNLIKLAGEIELSATN